MSPAKYSALPVHECNASQQPRPERENHPQWTFTAYTILTALILSLSINAVVLIRLTELTKLPRQEVPTQFAGLTWDRPFVVQYNSRFNDPDRQAEDLAWKSKEVMAKTFIVALDDSYSEAQGLAHSMRWPWDSSKGVYIINSGHELHCLHTLREAINDVFDYNSTRWHRSHLMHCVEFLLQNVMCTADDTPLYTGFLHASANATTAVPGTGTTRKCRDWDRLIAWANERSACYDPYYNITDPNLAETERYKFCPNGDTPWQSTIPS